MTEKPNKLQKDVPRTLPNADSVGKSQQVYEMKGLAHAEAQRRRESAAEGLRVHGRNFVDFLTRECITVARHPGAL